MEAPTNCLRVNEGDWRSPSGIVDRAKDGFSKIAAPVSTEAVDDGKRFVVSATTSQMSFHPGKMIFRPTQRRRSLRAVNMLQMHSWVHPTHQPRHPETRSKRGWRETGNEPPCCHCEGGSPTVAIH